MNSDIVYNILLTAYIFIGSYVLIRTIYISVFTPKLPYLTNKTYEFMTSNVDILVPVRNEVKRGLESNLNALVQQSHQAARVIVTDDQSSDGSADVISRIASKSANRLVYVKGVGKPHGWMGKTFALAQAKDQSDAEWIALVDADVFAHPNLISSAVNYAQTRGLDAISVLPKFEYRTFWVGIVLPVMIWISAMRVSPTQTNRKSSKRAFGLGNFIMVRRTAHDLIGSFEAYKSSVLDDCEIMERLKIAGYAIEVVDGATMLKSPMYTTLNELYLGFAKNSFAAINYNWARVIMFLLVECFLVAFPFFLMISHVTLFALGSLALVTGTMAIAGARVKAPPQHYFFFPIGHAIATLIVLSSAILTGFGNGVAWKGRTVG